MITPRWWRLVLWTALTVWAVTGAFAAVPPGRAGDGLAQAEGVQEQLRGTTGRVEEQLGAIIEEFSRSGLGGEDVQLLGAIRGLLGRLGSEDMGRVVALLQKARGGDEGEGRRSALIEAFGTQKSVGLKLRQILLEYQRQQELAGVAARLEELAARQQSSLKETLGLASTAAGRKREWLTENQRIALQLQVSEQQAVRDETLAVLQRLKAWRGVASASDEADEESAVRAAEAAAGPGAGRLVAMLEGAMSDLSAGKLLSALGRQRAARGGMRELARELVPPADEMESLLAAVRDLDLWTAHLEVLRASTRQTQGKPQEMEALIGRQVDLLDEVDFGRGWVGNLDASAGEQVGAAVGRMQEARGVLETGAGEIRIRRLASATQQDLALARLASARRLLQERIDTLEKQKAAAADPKSNLEQVRADVAELLKQERALKAEAAEVAADPARLRPMAPRQGDLGDRAQDAGKRAALDSPAAAELLSEAMRNMRTSQRTLGEGRNQPGAQQAAVDALAKALEALDEQLAELAKAEQELDELRRLLERLIAIIEAQQDLNASTARVARALPGPTPKELGTQQARWNVATRALEGDLPQSVAQAATYLGDAATQMILAGNELDAGRPGEARSPQDEAMANLQRARRELEERIAQLQEMLGQPPDEASMEKLAQAIKQAQQDVNGALSAEQLASLAKGLENAGRRVKPATSGRMGRMPRRVRESLQRAERSLSEGTAAGEAGDQAGATAEAGEAQEALAAAAAALDLAMAGMGQQPGEGQGQGGEGRNPGQGQGRGRGRTPGSQAGKGTGDAGNFFGSGGGDGPRRSASGGGRFIGLPPRERAALLQSQGERYPQEYAPMIEQYLRNLSDQVGEGPP